MVDAEPIVCAACGTSTQTGVFHECPPATVEIERLRRIVETMQLMDDGARLRTIKYLMSLYGCRYV